jgi:uncharacterized membrane protein YdfJ with MMPL/SSD domain
MSDATDSNGFPARLMRVLVGHPFVALALALAVAVALGSFVPGLRTDVSPTTLMVAGDEQLPVYEEAKRQFGSDELTIVVVKADDTGFDERFSDEVDALVADVASESGLEVYQIGRPYT